jgi:hypothetical protein
MIILYIDELSMMDTTWLCIMDIELKQIASALGLPQHVLFGRIKLVLAGDFFQLGPVGSFAPLWYALSTRLKHNFSSKCAYELKQIATLGGWNIFTMLLNDGFCIELTEVKRQEGDVRFRDFLAAIRNGESDLSQFREALRACVINREIQLHNARIIVETNVTRFAFNRLMVTKFASHYKRPIVQVLCEDVLVKQRRERAGEKRKGRTQSVSS